MPHIGIVDDREDFRRTLKRRMELSLQKGDYPNWTVIDIAPFNSMEDYMPWIGDNDIALLILDEKLQEVGNGNSVNYNGSNLIETIRMNLKEFPVFVITSYPKVEDLQSKFPLFDEILERDAFYGKSDQYVARFVRAGQRYLNTHIEQMHLIAEISQKIATGNASEEEKEQLMGLQLSIGLPHSNITTREKWINDYDEKLESLKELSSKIDLFLKNKDV